jgi:hypothetical protein
MQEISISVKIPIKCIGCARLRTKQISNTIAIAYCKDERNFIESGFICRRSTEFTD